MISNDGSNLDELLDPLDYSLFFDYLNRALPNSISYAELSNLCLTLFCTIDILPEKFQSLRLNKENLAMIFSKIAIEKEIAVYPPSASIYGASFHQTHDKGHWLEVMASVLKVAKEPNIKEAEKLLISKLINGGDN